MDALCKEGNLEEVETYLSGLIQEIQEYTGIQTGNSIADCFINMAIQDLEESGKVDYDIVGKFPNKMKVNHSDFCVLFANAVENAKEALEKVEGERKLILIIRNYQEKVYITLKNTVESEHKEDREETKHSNGYGLQNMKLVVEKYEGTIEWMNKDGFFELHISI